MHEDFHNSILWSPCKSADFTNSPICTYHHYHTYHYHSVQVATREVTEVEDELVPLRYLHHLPWISHPTPTCALAGTYHLQIAVVCFLAID